MATTYTNKSQIEFSTYGTRWECWDCKDGYSSHRYRNGHLEKHCDCDPIFYLNRIRIIFEEPIDKNTNYEISIEKDREVLSTEFPEKDQIQVEACQTLNMYCNLELSSDDETTIFEPHVAFFETFFNVKDELVALRNKIVFTKKMSKGKPVEIIEFQDEINKIKDKFCLNASSICEYTFSKHKSPHVKDMVIQKLAQTVLKLQIESLFDGEAKPNAHFGRKK